MMEVSGTRASSPALLLLLVLASGCRGQDRGAPVDLAALWDEAVPFSTFMEGAERRVETWHGNYDRGAELDAGLLASARTIPGSWRLLVVAEDWCGDSANTLPYAARLGEAVEGLEVRVVDSRAGRDLMQAYPTPDGRAATPTLVLLDETGTEVGCMVEQPRVLQEWWLGEAREISDEDERFEQKYAWYDEDAGRSTVAEVVAMMEGAAAGTPVCRARS